MDGAEICNAILSIVNKECRLEDTFHHALILVKDKMQNRQHRSSRGNVLPRRITSGVIHQLSSDLKSDKAP